MTNYYKTAWNVVASQSSKTKAIDVRSVITKILINFQQSDSNIVLIPTTHENEEENPVIYKPTEIPNNKIGLTKYLESPRIKNNKLLCRVQLGSLKEVSHAVESYKFKKWMSTNQIRLTISKLSSDQPLYAGFYTEPNPAHQNIGFLEDRITQHLNRSFFLEFQVEIVPIFSKGKGNSALVYMVMTTKNDVNMLRRKLAEPSQNIHKFHQWDHFEDLSELQILHIVQE
jgi:hypothetical protein